MSIGILVGLAGVAVLGITNYLENTSGPDSAYRCQEMGPRFVNEMRNRDFERGVPSDKLAYTYRSHYNFVEHKCFVRTDTRTVTPDGLGLKVTSINRVWDVAAGVGATPYAVESRTSSGREQQTLYQDSQNRPKDMDPEAWFKSLMTQ